MHPGVGLKKYQLTTPWHMPKKQHR